MKISTLVFDIETVADPELIRRSQFSDGLPEGFDDPVDAYKAQLLESSGGKSDFVPHTYQLPVSVAYAALDRDFRILKLGSLDRGDYRPHVIADQFWRLWEKHKPTFVTFNGRGFDLPVLEQCALRYGIAVPGWFSNSGPGYNQPRNRFNPASHFDLMDFLTNSGASRYTGGLDLAAILLGKPGKMGTKGSMVQELWDKGEKDRIDDYCVCDVLDTYFVFLRSQLLLGRIDLEKEGELVREARGLIDEKMSAFGGLADYAEAFAFWQAPKNEDSGFLAGL